MRGQNQDKLSRLLDEFCALVFGALRPSPALPTAPPAAVVSHPPASSSAPAGGRRRRASPAGLAALLLGASLALMLCGSVTFMIGFILMPWVLGLVMVLHFLGMLSNLSALWRPSPASPTSPQKASGQLFSKLPIV